MWQGKGLLHLVRRGTGFPLVAKWPPPAMSDSIDHTNRQSSRSHPHTEDKPVRARSVPSWVTRQEPRVLMFCFCTPPSPLRWPTAPLSFCQQVNGSRQQCGAWLPCVGEGSEGVVWAEVCWHLPRCDFGALPSEFRADFHTLFKP